LDTVDTLWLRAVVRAIRIADYTGQESVDLSECRPPRTPVEDALRTGLLGQHILRCQARAADTANGDWILRTLDEHAADPDCTPESLARILRVSLSTLSRRCQALTGHAVMGQIHHIRVHRARTLLLDRRLPIKVVACNVGYGWAAALRRHFTDIVGVPPSAYRQARS
jgi:transcriptional regulator GlxA family with amidase domain